MNRPPRILLLALALVTLSAAARAEDPVETDWLDLDAKLDTLAASVLPDALEVKTGVVVRAFYTISDDSVLGASDDDSLSGMQLIDADLAVAGKLENWCGRISFDVASGSVELQDAWARWSVDPRFAVRAGNIKPTVSFANSADPELLLFQDRTYLGARFDTWDAGVEVSGTYDQFDWSLGFLNGADELTDENLWVARGVWSHYDNAWPAAEGARNAPRHLRMMLGATFFADTLDTPAGDNQGWGFDGLLTYGPYGVHTAIMLLDDGAAGTTTGDGVPAVGFDGDTSPWDVTISRMIGEQWQAGVRYQETDNADDLRAMGLAVHYYPEKGPTAFVAEVVEHKADAGPEGWFFRLGFNVGRSRR